MTRDWMRSEARRGWASPSLLIDTVPSRSSCPLESDPRRRCRRRWTTPFGKKPSELGRGGVFLEKKLRKLIVCGRRGRAPIYIYIGEGGVVGCGGPPGEGRMDSLEDGGAMRSRRDVGDDERRGRVVR